MNLQAHPMDFAINTVAPRSIAEAGIPCTSNARAAVLPSSPSENDGS